MKSMYCHKHKVKIGRAARPHAAAILSVLVCAALNSLAAEYDVAAYVWPAYQGEPRWMELKIFAHGNGEWQSVYEARPKRDGHYQPLVPYWGYEKDDDPKAVARQIDAALAAGVNVFVYDWYWYEGRPFLENALNNGFLKAPNSERMKFSIMYANHNVNSRWDNKAAELGPTIWKSYIPLDEFKRLCDRWVSMYFTRPNYHKINGKCVFSFYQFYEYVKGVGGVANAKEGIEYLRNAVRKAGLGGLHLQLLWHSNDDPTEQIKLYGFDSVSMYNWTSGNHFFSDEEMAALKRDGSVSYRKWADAACASWDRFSNLSVPFYPTVSIGYDDNPRFPPQKWTEVMTPATPQEFEEYVRKAKSYVDANTPDGVQKVIYLNAWNEWTEGATLQPDERYGYGYLNALWRVFMQN